MATTRIKDVSKTTTDLASDEYIIADGATNGTQKMARDDAYADWAAAYVAAPTTYKLAPLNSGTNKIDATYLPTGADTAKGAWDANANSPALADGGAGTAGDYYDVTVAGSQDLGSGPIDYTVGDVVKYDGANWYKIDSVANVLDGSATASAGRTTLDVLSNDELASDFGTKLVGPSLSFDGTNAFIEIADDDKFTFTSTSDLGDSSGVWTATTNSPAITDGTGTLNDNYKITTTGTVAQGASTLSIIDGVSATAGQVVYYDGAVWRLKDSDDLPFSTSGWVKMTDATGFPIIAKYGNGVSGEWRFYNNGDDLSLFLNSSSGNSVGVVSTSALTAYEGQWIHVAATYPGAGPNSDNAFSSAGDGIKLYINGVAVAMDAAVETGTYAGMVNGANPVRVGRESGNYADGKIKDVKLFNRELSAAEVTKLYKAGQLGFADEFGGAEVYTGDSSTFTSSLGNWTEEGVTAITVAQSGGEMVITNTAATTGTRGVKNTTNKVTEGKRYRISWTSRASSGTGQALNLSVFNGSPLAAISKLTGSGTAGSVGSSTVYTFTPTVSAERHSLEFVIAGGGTDSLYFKMANTGSGEVYNFDSITLTQIGTLADFRAENFDTSTGKLYDSSDNDFVGTSSNLPSLVGREFPVYRTGNWTPTITFGGGSTGITYTAADGYYTRVGNICFFRGAVILSSKGSDTGLWVINGLPYTSESVGINSSMVQVYLTTANGLTSVPFGVVGDGTTDVTLFDNGSTGATVLTDANAQNTTTMRISGTYQIQ